MRPRRAPLRFLALVATGWLGARAVVLTPGLVAEEPAAPATAAAASARRAIAAAPAPAFTPPPAIGAPATRSRWRAGETGRRQPGRDRRAPSTRWPEVQGFALTGPSAIVPPGAAAGRVPAFPAAHPPTRQAASRWSASGWLLLRRERTPSLVAGGTLGGSQAGVRIAYRLAGRPSRPLALSVRVSAPVRRGGGEAAFGLDWRPVRSLPVHVLAERRQRVGQSGRSAFALTAYGGATGERMSGRLRLDVYGQAGIVGLRSRDAFIDGAARLSVAAGRVELGAGLWGGAQPGAARLDAGPQISVRLPIAGRGVRMGAEWRFRIAGDARPGSGPALTLATDL